MYFDIHAHIKTFNGNTDRIISLFPNEASDLCPSWKYSIGIHPSFILEKKLKSELVILSKLASQKSIIAIGEIGLDKNAKIPIYSQILVFQQQLKIAEELNKPVIIHCVRCFSEIIALKKGSTVPWIIHGFRGKPELAAQLIKKGIYLSFGSAILNDCPTLYSTVRETPSDKIFLETDDSKVNIKLIYEKAAEIKEISVEALIEAININKRLI